jgi:1-acyl-sn-glycerol-3-phosphate acyltransferase
MLSIMDATSNLKNLYPYPRNRFVRTLLRWGIGASASILTWVKLIGRENLPENGPLIVIANHFIFLDAVMLIWAVTWPIEFLADFEMPNVPTVLKWIPKCYQTYDVTQGTTNIEALRASEAILAQSGILGIFPEGRVHPPPLQQALPGSAFLALRTSAPILPVGIYSDKGWDVMGSIIQDRYRLQVTCHFGPVFGVLECGSPRRPDRATIVAAGERMMEEIAKLLPLEMRGLYYRNLVNQT